MFFFLQKTLANVFNNLSCICLNKYLKATNIVFDLSRIKYCVYCFVLYSTDPIYTLRPKHSGCGGLFKVKDA